MMRKIKALVRSVTPRVVWRFLQRRKARVGMALATKRDPADVFYEIYRENRWAAEGQERTSDYFSGPGSEPLRTLEYEAFVCQFVREYGINRIVDLGCGDFQVGQRILENVDCDYVGVDVVPDLIERNRRKFSSKRISFECCDVIKDEFPDGNLYLVREVLQHLDNNSINTILDKLSARKFALITECQPTNPRKKNIDIIIGSRTRVLFRSGVYFDAPPFSRNVDLVVEVPSPPNEILRTYLLRQ